MDGSVPKKAKPGFIVNVDELYSKEDLEILKGPVPLAKLAYILNIDELVAPLDEVEVARVLNLLSSTLRESTDKLKILDKLASEEKELIFRSISRQQWMLSDTLKVNEVPEVALLLKIIIAQQAGYEDLVQRTEKIRHFEKYDQKYYEDARLAVHTLDRVKAALNNVPTASFVPTESFWHSMQY